MNEWEVNGGYICELSCLNNSLQVKLCVRDNGRMIVISIFYLTAQAVFLPPAPNAKGNRIELIDGTYKK